MNRLIALAGIGLLTFLGACNTIQGAGQDISQGGEALSDTATEVEQDL
jgi:predicted small secreted protein